MKIYLGDYLIARGRAYKEEPLDLKINGERNIQITHLLHSKEAKVYDRGNLKNRIEFKVPHKHKNLEAALKYALTHSTNLGEYIAYLRFIIEENEPIELIMPNCVVERLQCEILGITTLHVYHLVGGSIHVNPNTKLSPTQINTNH